MSKTYNATGIVLRRADYREHDRLFVLYTKEYGKVEVIAKGTKKILSKLNPHLEPFHEVAVMIAKGKGFDKMGNAIVMERFASLREQRDPGVIAAVHYMLEATERLVQRQYPDAEVYEVLRGGLEYFGSHIEHAPSLGRQLFVANVYILKLLMVLGYRPELSRCTECAKGMVFPDRTYDFLRGGLVCERCKPITLIHDHYDISDTVIKLLNVVLDEEYGSLGEYQLDARDMNEFNFIVIKLLEYQYDRPLESLRFIKALAAEQQKAA